ncbi:MAG: response regulator transcription factor [Jatrophihabitans sp.]|uniref:response regulator transcription factor n=1 Tax=Jatrophihabitans sp. TaxID=1932789 RepID=UPI003F80A97F
MASVLVVEDDTTISRVVATYLERNGHTAEVIADGRVAYELLSWRPPDLVILDVMLPGMDGLEVCRRVRADDRRLPIVMLTARGEPEERILGLECGADDYVAKPFSPRELVLRVESVLRRAASRIAPGGPPVTAGAVTVDLAGRRAFRHGVELVLTVREFELLAFLITHPRVAFRRSELMRAVWGWTYGDQSTVTVHVRRLREKVEDDPTNPTLIQTVWGVGYLLEAP